MGQKLFVGNLSFQVTSDQLRELFTPHGEVKDAVVLTDRDTGRSRGFGFVTMGNDAEAQAAMQALNGQEVDGRPIKVNEAMERQPGGGSRGGSRGGSGGGGGGWRGGSGGSGGGGGGGGRNRY